MVCITTLWLVGKPGTYITDWYGNNVVNPCMLHYRNCMKACMLKLIHY